MSCRDNRSPHLQCSGKLKFKKRSFYRQVFSGMSGKTSIIPEVVLKDPKGFLSKLVRFDKNFDFACQIFIFGINKLNVTKVKII